LVEIKSKNFIPLWIKYSKDLDYLSLKEYRIPFSLTIATWRVRFSYCSRVFISAFSKSWKQCRLCLSSLR